MAEAGIGLGSNLGNRAATIEAALARLDSTPSVRVLRRSRLYSTEPWGDTEQEFFLNACAVIETTLQPRELLQVCMDIEHVLGRDRAHERRWGPRTADLDILFYGTEAVDEPGLALPHPHLFERAFVLIPLAEIDGERIVSGRRIGTAAEMADASGIELWEA